MKKFTFEFTEEQANYILNVLATRPYKEVRGLLEMMQQQAQGQLEETPQTTLEPVE